MIKERKPLTSGMKFGKLTVIRQVEDRVTPTTMRAAYECACDCGGVKTTTSFLLKRGEATSCGCNLFRIGDFKRTHGMSGTPTYWSWGHMMQRCTNTESPDYPDYGARGIIIEDGWQDFNKFFTDMGECPEGLSLDRIDVHGNYSFDNCRWATDFEQAVNRRKKSVNTSGRTGVHWHKQHQKWYVSLRHRGEKYYGGLHTSFESAVKARERLELEHIGEVRSLEYETRLDLENKGAAE